MISLLRFSRRLSAFALILICVALLFAAPARNRTIQKFSRANEPVELIAVKFKGKPVTFGKAFAAQDNWIGGITVVIKNISTKPVDWVKVALKFPNPKGPAPYLVDFIIYGVGRSDIEKIRGGGPPLKPGETAEASYSLEQYQSIRDSLDGMSYPRSLNQVEVSVQQVSFENAHDVMWIEGQICKEDYHSPTGWSPVKP